MAIPVLYKSIRSRSISADNTNSKKKSTASRIISRYGIGGTNEDNESDADSGGTKSFPSRTFIGSKSAFGEKHGWALKPLILFGGLIVIPEYMYRYKMSVAKRQIMALDIPRIEYNTKKTDNANSGPRKLKANDQSLKLQEEANRKARERRKQNEWQRMKLSDLQTQTNTKQNG